MSLLGTLAKVAVGVVVAKGVSGMVAGQRGSVPGTAPRGGASAPGSGSIFGDMFSPGAGGGGLGGLLGGGLGSGGAGSGGLGSGGDLLGGLGKLLAGRGGGASGGGLGGLLEGLSQASRPGGSVNVAPPGGGSLGDLLNQSLERFGEPATSPAPEHEDAARIMLRAMLQAAKSDGRIDAREKEKLLGQLGDISPEDMDFINAELARPIDIPGLARDVPAGMGAQVYAMSLLAIDLDSRKEAAYLTELATALALNPGDVNAIHDKMGAPRIFG